MAKATSNDLDALHAGICAWGVAKLAEQEPVNAMTPEGPVTVGWKLAAQAKDIAALTKFLSDNKVTADLGTNKGLADLHKELASKKKHSDNVVAMPSAQAAAAGVREVRNA